eukprot:COSAG02_NODE_400_length_23094_cov_309.555990_20_plen_112_part_00
MQSRARARAVARPHARRRAVMLVCLVVAAAATAQVASDITAASACAEFSLADGANARMDHGGGMDALRIRVLPPPTAAPGMVAPSSRPAFRDDLPSALLPPLAGSSAYSEK